MPPLIDLTGKRFGRWTVIKRGPSKKRRTRWHCRCDCGNKKLVLVTSLRNGHSQSCGCYNREFHTKHGDLNIY